MAYSLDDDVALIYGKAEKDVGSPPGLADIAIAIFGETAFEESDAATIPMLTWSDDTAWTVSLPSGLEPDALVMALASVVAQWWVHNMPDGTKPDSSELAQALMAPTPALREMRSRHGRDVAAIAEELHAPVEVVQRRLRILGLASTKSGSYGRLRLVG